MRAEKPIDGVLPDPVVNFRAELSNARLDCRIECVVMNFRLFFPWLDQPIGGELMAVKLLSMITRFCSGSAPHFPMKKVLLLLWKVSLVGLGGMQTLRELKSISFVFDFINELIKPIWFSVQTNTARKTH